MALRTGGSLPSLEGRVGEFEAAGSETRDHLIVLVSDLPAPEHRREAERLLPRAAGFLATFDR